MQCLGNVLKGATGLRPVRITVLHHSVYIVIVGQTNLLANSKNAIISFSV